MTQCLVRELHDQPADWAPPSPSSCGLDVWHTEPALTWIGDFLRAKSSWLEVSDAMGRAGLRFVVRHLPLGVLLGSAYPYGAIEGDVTCFLRNLEAIRSALLRQRIVRLEIPFTGEYLTQFPEPIPPGADGTMGQRLAAVRQVLDLSAFSSDQDLEKSFEPNLRWALRKSIRSGCKVRAATLNDVPIVQSLYETTMRAKGAPVNYGAERFSGIIESLTSRDLGCVYLGTVNDAPAGMAAVIGGANSQHLVQVAVPPQWHPTRLGELLIATTIRDALARHKRFFDFMASPIEDEGLIAFKRKWGGTTEPIHHLVIPAAPLIAQAIDGARWINRKLAKHHVR